MGGQNKAPVRLQAQPGQAGGISIPYNAMRSNAAMLRLAKLRDLGLTGERAGLLAGHVWGGPTDAG